MSSKNPGLYHMSYNLYVNGVSRALIIMLKAHYVRSPDHWKFSSWWRQGHIRYFKNISMNNFSFYIFKNMCLSNSVLMGGILWLMQQLG